MTWSDLAIASARTNNAAHPSNNPADGPACQIRGANDRRPCGQWCTDTCGHLCEPFGHPPTDTTTTDPDIPAGIGKGMHT